jgi:surface polysaccharide O-acyltransferase-like enzyme
MVGTKSVTKGTMVKIWLTILPAKIVLVLFSPLLNVKMISGCFLDTNPEMAKPIDPNI